MLQRVVHPIARARHLGWISRAIVSGFLASLAALIVLLPAYGFAAAVGTTSPNANFFSAWMYHLANNPVVSLVANIQMVQAVGLHMAIGLVWAVVYAALIEPTVQGPGWRKGLLFAIVPCLISLVVVLPIVGAGFAGFGVGAGPVAGLGIVLLHAVYGLVLGETYALADGEGMWGGVDSPVAKTFTLVERDMAMGLIIGALLGAIVSLILRVVGVVPSGADIVAQTLIGGATEGAIAGVVIGVLIGLITSD